MMGGIQNNAYFPDLPHAKEITLKNLSSMTSGYADYVYQPEVLVGTVLQPFRQFTPQELIHRLINDGELNIS